MTPQLWFLTLVGAIVLGLVILVVLLASALGNREDKIDRLRRELVLSERETRQVRADLIAALGQLAAVSDERDRLQATVDADLNNLLPGDLS